MKLQLPGAESRTVIIGSTGDGKTNLAGWLLSKQNFQVRAWVWLDFKDEVLLDEVGSPPIKRLRLGEMPGKRGLYRLTVYPGQEDALEAWLWKVWRRGNIGIVCDEVSLIPQRDAFKSILRQGRSKRIPVISCTQRPVDCDREVFTESQYLAVFTIGDVVRDYPVIRGLFGGHDVRTPLPEFWCYWYDRKQKELFILRPTPAPAIVAADLKRVAPYSYFLGS